MNLLAKTKNCRFSVAALNGIKRKTNNIYMFAKCSVTCPHAFQKPSDVSGQNCNPVSMHVFHSESRPRAHNYLPVTMRVCPDYLVAEVLDTGSRVLIIYKEWQ